VLEPSREAVLAEKQLREGQGLEPEPSLLRVAGQAFCNRSYIQAFTPAVRDIFESFAFHRQVDRLEKAGLLFTVSNAEMGLVFVELIRKFAELSNETAGEHFTPRWAPAACSAWRRSTWWE
jgi:type I restriction enzyme M protein